MSTVAQTEVQFSISSRSSDGSPTACPSGQIRDTAGYCVPDSNPTPCAGGEERASNGTCVPVTGAGAKGKLTKINRPSTVNADEEFQITCIFKNIGTQSARFSIHVKIPQFMGLDTLTRFIKVIPGAEGTISIKLKTPKMTNDGSIRVKGLLELVRSVISATNANNIVIDHSVNFDFTVVKFLVI